MSDVLFQVCYVYIFIIDFQEKKSLISFENVLASAVAQDPDATTAYLDTILNEVKTKSGNSTLDEEQLKALRLTFPRGGILGILEKNPNVLPKCEHDNFE